VALHSRHHPVAVEGFLHVHGGDVDVAAALLRRAHRLVGDDESVTGRAAMQPADDEVHPIGQPHAGAVDLHDLARGDHLPEDALQLVPVVGSEREAPHDLADPHGLSGLLEELQDPVPQRARDGAPGLLAVFS
jgi:hypothetical protein